MKVVRKEAHLIVFVHLLCLRPDRAEALSDDARLTYDVCLLRTLNIHGAHSYWKQGMPGATGVRRAGPQRAA